MIIHKYVITLFMYCYYIKKFKDFDIFLTCNDWLMLLKEVEEEYLTSQN